MRTFEEAGAQLPATNRGSAAGRPGGVRATLPILAPALRAAGALSLLAVGAVHLQQYVELYSAIPTIGTLFVLNFVGATVVGLGLLVPVERSAGRFAGAVPLLLAVAGIGMAATAFAFLLISERTPLFGFMEPGYDPAAIMAARVAEITTVLFLGGYLAARLAGRRADVRRAEM